MISVGAVTEHGCAAAYSNTGPGLDIVAPGGGKDAALPDQPNCVPNGPVGRPIFQLTFTSKVKQTFGYPTDYFGTSMATPHVSATAALIIASGVIGPNPTPEADRSAPEGHGPRPRRARAGRDLRRRPGQRRRRYRAALSTSATAIGASPRCGASARDDLDAAVPSPCGSECCTARAAFDVDHPVHGHACPA